MRVRGKIRLLLLSAFCLKAWSAIPHADPSVSNPQTNQDCSPQDPAVAEQLLFLTGPQGGNYLKVGNAIAAVASAHGFSKLRVCSVGQTFDNMRQIERTGGAAFALVQSDVAHAFWYGHAQYLPQDGKSTPNSAPYLVTPLYIEAVHILVRPHLNISGPSELRNRRVWLGPAHHSPLEGDSPPSGTEFSARRVLEAAGLNSAEMDSLERTTLDPIRCPGETREVRNLEFSDARRALLNMCLDAMFYVGMVPSDKVRSVLDIAASNSGATTTTGEEVECEATGRRPKASELAEARLLSLDYPLVRRLVQDGSYVEKLIGASEYCEDESTLTVGVQALLLGRGGQMNLENIHQLAAIVRTYRSEIEAQMGLQPPSDLSLLGMPVRPHLAAHTPLADWPYIYQTWKTVWVPFLFACAACSLVLWLVVSLNRARLGRLISENNLLIPGVVGVFMLWIGAAFLLNQFDGEVNERLSSFPRALRYAPLYLSPVSGFSTLTEDGQMTQRVGQWIAGVVLLGGVLAPLATQKLVPQGILRLSRIMLRRGPVTGRLENHIVIINRSPRADDVIRHLHAQQIRNKRPIVLVTHAEVSFSSEPEFDSVQSVVGDIADNAILNQAQITRAHSLTILSAWPPPDPNDRRKFLRGDSADSKTILTIQTVREFLAADKDCARVPINAELKSRKNLRAAYLAANDADVNLICEEDLGTELLTQCTATPGLTKLYKQLLSCSDNRSELYRISMPSECIGKQFGGLILHFAENRRDGKSAEIPIGLYRNANLFLNPPDNEIGELQEGDHLLVIAERPRPASDTISWFQAWRRPTQKPAA